MMDAFNVTLLEALGYDFKNTIGFSNPTDTRFAPQDYSAQAFESAAVTSAVMSLASLNPYGGATSIMAAQSAYYATAGYPTASADASTPTNTGTGDYIMHGLGGGPSNRESGSPSTTAAQTSAPVSQTSTPVAETSAPVPQTSAPAPSAQPQGPPSGGPPNGPPGKRSNVWNA